MNLLARREHSRRELHRKLVSRFDGQEVDDALRRLAEEGLQSDRRFALSYTRERALRGYGPLKIEQELLQRGVSGCEAGAALRALADEEGLHWSALARAALEKKFGMAAMPDDFAERAKRLRFLQYRGFRTEDIDADAC